MINLFKNMCKPLPFYRICEMGDGSYRVDKLSVAPVGPPVYIPHAWCKDIDEAQNCIARNTVKRVIDDPS